MMEHALFIRGLLDPTEEELIDIADDFAHEFKCLRKEANHYIRFLKYITIGSMFLKIYKKGLSHKHTNVL